MPESAEIRSVTLAVTIGDPQGIGAEITAKALATQQYGKTKFMVLGDIAQFQKTAERLNITLSWEHLTLVDTGTAAQKKSGAIAYDAIETALLMIAESKADALVTGPISKERLWEAGIPDSGHTEILERLSPQYFASAGQPQADMLFVHDEFRLLLLTRHTPLSEVSKTLTIEGVKTSLNNLVLDLKARGIEKPKLAVLGVNPHAGEIGGQEETFILQPAIDSINQQYGLAIEPPKAADAFFRGFDAKNPCYDAVVASYHDQGMIPMKLIAGLSAVNVTIGLPFVRTSVSHGTADDIAGQGKASSESLLAAIQEAEKLVCQHTLITPLFNNNSFSTLGQGC